MLVLTRKADEGILLGDDIRLVVLSIDGDRVRLGIDAPRSLRIFRAELVTQTKALNRESIQAPLSVSFKDEG